MNSDKISKRKEREKRKGEKEQNKADMPRYSKHLILTFSLLFAYNNTLI